MAAVGLLAAERHRRINKKGQLVRIALTDVALAMLGNLGKIAEVAINDHDRAKDGNFLYGAFGRDFETLEGQRVMVVALTDPQWKGLVKATGMESVFSDLQERSGLDLQQAGNRYRVRREIAKIMEPVVPRSGAQRDPRNIRQEPRFLVARIEHCDKSSRRIRSVRSKIQCSRWSNNRESGPT